MKSTLHFDFSIDKKNNTIHVSREFAANLSLVWDAWTKPALLDQWWAPKPYQTKTISMDFQEGGTWLYYMVSPENEKHYCRADYKKINHQHSYSALDAFCDEKGMVTKDFPRSLWTNTFSEKAGTTMVTIVIEYKTLEDLEKIVSLGFKEGFIMAIGNLDQFIEEQFKRRNEL